MNVTEAAERWARTWEQAWPARDPARIAALYAPTATYRSHPHRDPEVGGALAYTTKTFAEEQSIECHFGAPIASDGRAAVEWWASWIEDDRELTLSGTTILRFDDEGLVIDHVDYWVESAGRRLPFSQWGTAHTL